MDIFPEPARPLATAAIVAGRLNDLMGRDVDGLNNFADGTCLDQLSGVNRGLHFQSLGVHDGIDAAGLRDGSPDQRQVLQRGDARFVGEKILACPHGAHADTGPLAGDLR